MIYPSVYSFSAPYRGPKESNEINKLFTSIVYDLNVATNEIQAQSTNNESAVKFFLNGDGLPEIPFPTAGSIEGTNYAYTGIHKQLNSISITQKINHMNDRVTHILKYL